jgi:type IV pilus assembly protein PilM
VSWNRIARPAWDGLVGVERSGDGYRVVDSRGSGSAGDATAPAPRALQDLVLEGHLRGRPAAAILEGHDVLVRRLSLPPLKRQDLLSALTLECRKHVPYPLEEAELRFEVLGPSVQAPGGQDLLVAVAPRRAVEETRAALEESGLRPVALTIRPVAVRALVRSTPAASEAEVTAFLDMGARESQITVFRGDEIRFTRDCGVGVGSFADALRSIVVPGQGMVALGAGEAGQLLRTTGIPGPEREGLAPEGVPLAAVSVMLRPILERLVRELWNSFDYVHEQFQGQAVSRVRLMGDGMEIPGLAEHLAGILKIPVGRADIQEGGGTEWTSAAGLSRVAPGGINFLEPAGAGAAYRIAEAIPQKVALVAAAVLLVSVALPAQVTLVRERQRVSALEAEIASVAPHRSQVDRFREARRLEVRSRVLHTRLAAGSPAWSEVLRDLSHRVGRDARLVSLALVERPRNEGAALPVAAAAQDLSGRTVRIEGLLRRDGYRSERELAELMHSLERSPWWRDVRLVSAQAMGSSRTRFTLLASIAEGP